MEFPRLGDRGPLRSVLTAKREVRFNLLEVGLVHEGVVVVCRETVDNARRVVAFIDASPIGACRIVHRVERQETAVCARGLPPGLIALGLIVERELAGVKLPGLFADVDILGLGVLNVKERHGVEPSLAVAVKDTTFYFQRQLVVNPL